MRLNAPWAVCTSSIQLILSLTGALLVQHGSNGCIIGLKSAHAGLQEGIHACSHQQILPDQVWDGPIHCAVTIEPVAFDQKKCQVRSALEMFEVFWFLRLGGIDTTTRTLFCFFQNYCVQILGFLCSYSVNERYSCPFF